VLVRVVGLVSLKRRVLLLLLLLVHGRVLMEWVALRRMGQRGLCLMRTVKISPCLTFHHLL